jgi:gliding motility-associated-like protein
MKLKKFLKAFAISLCIATTNFSFGQITIDNSQTVAQLVTNLMGTGVTYSNISFQGVRNVGNRYQIGAFSTATTTQTQMGFGSGVVLSTGNTSDIPLTLGTNPGTVGQMSYGYASCTTGEVRQGGTCPTYINDLDVLTGSVNYYNAAVLEFDFVPVGDSINFKYVFGSEEYSDQGGFINYQCSSYNDKFGFLISGPGVAGGAGYTNNARNIARLSNGTEVGINSVNSGVVGSSGGAPSAATCTACNPAWIQNTATAEYNGHIDGTQLNGNTDVLTAAQGGLTPGQTYHIKMLILDANDAAYDAVVYIQAGSFSSPVPSLTVTASPTTICSGSSTQLSATITSGTPNYTYTWSDGSTTIHTTSGTVSTTDQFTVNPTTTTTYYVTVTDQAGPVTTSIGSVVVNVTPLPSVSASSNSPVCSNQTLNLSSFPAGATSYSWAGPNSFVSGTQNPSISSVTTAATGIYSVTATVAGCSNTTTTSVTINPTPSITVNSPTICSGASAILTANGGTTYVWSDGSTVNPTTVNPGGTISYTVTGTSSGCSGSAISTVTVGPSLNITVNNPTICNGNQATLTANGGTAYEWSDGSTTNPTTVNPGSTTSYTVTGTTSGCSGTTISTVTVNPNPVISVNDTTICTGSIAILTATGGTTYLWNTTATTNPIVVSPSNTTSYTVTGTSSGCNGTAISTVTVTPIPNITVNSPTICPATSAILTAIGGNSYSWSNGSTINPITVSPASTTSYTVTGTLSGCIGTAVSTVTVSASLNITVNSPTICAGSNATLTANGGTTYEWSNGSSTNPTTVNPSTTTSYTVTGTSSGCTGTTITTVIVNPLPIGSITGDNLICAGTSTTLTAAGGTTYLWTNSATTSSITVYPVSSNTYSVTVTNNGCSSISNYNVNIAPAPIANAGMDTTITNGGNVQLIGTGGGTYLWTPAMGLSCVICSNPIASPEETTTYILEVTDTNGCKNSDTVTVFVDIECGEVFVANVFSPNNDGRNDVQCVQGKCIQTMVFSIYDRWGEKVFESEDMNQCWDGNYKGKALNTAVFVYYLKAIMKDGTELIKKGNITLIR